MIDAPDAELPTIEAQQAREDRADDPPTEAEAAHDVLRRWCPDCETGQTEEGQTTVEIQTSALELDYSFITDGVKKHEVKLLGGSLSQIEAIVSSVVNQKGADAFAEEVILAFLEEFGVSGDMVMKVDQEHGLVHDCS